MKRKHRRYQRRRHNPVGTKIAIAVGLTALVAAAVGAGIYFAKKDAPTLPPKDPGGSSSGGATPPPKDEPPKDVVLPRATQTMAQGEPYQPGLHHGLDAEGNY